MLLLPTPMAISQLYMSSLQHIAFTLVCSTCTQLLCLHVRVGFADAVEASSIEHCTWPSATVRAFGCINVLSWDRRLDLAMSAFTCHALHGVGSLPAGGRSWQITKTNVTLVSHERLSLFQRAPIVPISKCKNAGVFPFYIPGYQLALQQSN